jgi:predicted peroxiredoxin
LRFRGIAEEDLLEGARIGSLSRLMAHLDESDAVLTFGG